MTSSLSGAPAGMSASLAPFVLCGGYGLRMAHDLANDLTTLSALKMLFEKSRGRSSAELETRVLQVLDTVTQSLSQHILQFNRLRERFEDVAKTMSGESFIERWEEQLSVSGWSLEQISEMPSELVCCWDLFRICISAIRDLVSDPRVVTVSQPPAELTGGRPMLALSLGPVVGDGQEMEKNEVFVSVQQILRSMEGLLDLQRESPQPSLRILLSRND